MGTIVKLLTGELWDEVGKADLLLVTSNATVNKQNKLVMGRGAALEMAQRYPEIPQRIGTILRKEGQAGKEYGIILLETIDRGTQLGLFQVKLNWYEQAKPMLIRNATSKLANYLEMYNDIEVAMNYPGIGNGRLEEEEVWPIIRELPERVRVYKKA